MRSLFGDVERGDRCWGVGGRSLFWGRSFLGNVEEGRSLFGNVSGDRFFGGVRGAIAVWDVGVRSLLGCESAIANKSLTCLITAN